jgi:Holliday junction DNA helicase RuvA
MIEYLKGELTDLQPAEAVIECHGVGYGVGITLNTFSALQGKEGTVKLYISESIREDAYQLWGFATKAEREIFLLLQTVSGIGAATARVILSALSTQELADIILSGNDKMLKRVKGIGPKAAQRIIVELQDKVTTLAYPQSEGENTDFIVNNTTSNVVMEEASSALTMLGFSPAPVRKVVQKILSEEPEAPVERVIKLALKML